MCLLRSMLRGLFFISRAIIVIDWLSVVHGYDAGYLSRTSLIYLSVLNDSVN